MNPEQPEGPLSMNEIFEHRKKYIPEVGEQLQAETSTEVEIGGEKLNIDYRVISVEDEKNPFTEPIVLLPGFGSGREGITELGFSLACEGREVILPSLPGYGNSDNPNQKYYDTDNFDNEAEAIKQLLIKLETKGRVHLIGHSMGSEVLASLAQKYPEGIASLTLLNPAGIEEKEDTIALATRFLASGAYTNAEAGIRYALSGEKDYQKELHKYIDDPESPFSKDRLKQRLAETKKISEGKLLEKLENLDENIPVNYISGELDTVYPPGQETDETSQLARVINAVNNKDNISTSIMQGLRHNTTLAPDEITAANISHYLDKAEDSRGE